MMLLEEAALLKQPAYWAKPVAYDDFLRRPDIAKLVATPAARAQSPADITGYCGSYYDADTKSVALSKALLDVWKRSVTEAEPGTSSQIRPGAALAK